MIETQTPAAPVETVTPIKPSEALRLGRLVRPVQSYLWLEDDNGACACGAIATGWGFGDWSGREEVLERLHALGVDAYGGVVRAYLAGRYDADSDGDAAVLAYLESRCM